MKKYPAIDIFRLVCACLVVMIHYYPDPQRNIVANVINQCFSRQAVPFFLIVSGFFFTHKLFCTEDKTAFTQRYCARILIYYGIWILLQLPSTLEVILSKHAGRSALYVFAIIVRRVFLAGTAPFWYLLILAETAFLAGILLAFKKEKLLYCLSFIGFLLAYFYETNLFSPVLDPLYKFFYTLFSWSNNFIMMLPYFTLGVLFYQKREKIRFTVQTLIILYCLVSAVVVACFLLAPGSYKYLYHHAPQAALLFLIGLCLDSETAGEKLSAFCRRNSAAIYCLHNFSWILIPALPCYAADLFSRILLCVFICEFCRVLKIRPLYRIITLQ